MKRSRIYLACGAFLICVVCLLVASRQRPLRAASGVMAREENVVTPTENPLQGIFSPENLKKAKTAGVQVAAGERPDQVVLRFPPVEKPWNLSNFDWSNDWTGGNTFTIPVPPAARDWTGYGTFTFEFVSNSTLRWFLQIRNRKGEKFNIRVQPFENIRSKAAVTDSYLTTEYLANHQFKGHWLSSRMLHIDLKDVDSLVIYMNPNREVTLRLGPLALVHGEVADELYVDKPVVDRFGQWIPSEWPGKIHSVDELKAAWEKENAELARPEEFPFDRYGGWTQGKERATGFFHAAQVEGRWWLVDPDGHLFFSTGVDSIHHHEPTLVKGREQLFASLPPGTGDRADFYDANVRLRYGEETFAGSWKAKTEQRLKSWGFNTLANWADPALFEKPAIPFVTTVGVRFPKNWQGYPDAYSQEFVRAAEESALAQCLRFRNETYLIGYFIGNEPHWHERNPIELILGDPESSATQTFVRNFLKEKGDTPASRDELLETLTRHYFQVVCDAIRKADANHMILGIRWASTPTLDSVLRANDVFDIFSINIYRMEVPPEQIQHIYDLVKKPVIIGEFHFGAVDRGYAPSLVAVKDQHERGVAYQYYVEHAAALPALVGTAYFQMTEQPVTGRSDGENYNFGIVNQLDIPYADMVSFVRATSRRVYAVHAGKEPPVTQKAKVLQ